jgi:hypothetical protein
MTTVLIAKRSTCAQIHPGYTADHHRTAVTSHKGNFADA